jgi:methionyl-tRNA synthetase
MNVKLAKEKITSKETIEISIKDMIECVNGLDVSNKVYYLDESNSHKSILDAVEKLEKEGFIVKHRELKYGLANNEYMYELHILNLDA